MPSDNEIWRERTGQAVLESATRNTQRQLFCTMVTLMILIVFSTAFLINSTSKRLYDIQQRLEAIEQQLKTK